MALEIKELLVNLHLEKSEKAGEPTEKPVQNTASPNLAEEVAERVLRILREQQER